MDYFSFPGRNGRGQGKAVSLALWDRIVVRIARNQTSSAFSPATKLLCHRGNFDLEEKKNEKEGGIVAERDAFFTWKEKPGVESIRTN